MSNSLDPDQARLQRLSADDKSRHSIVEKELTLIITAPDRVLFFNKKFDIFSYFSKKTCVIGNH